MYQNFRFSLRKYIIFFSNRARIIDRWTKKELHAAYERAYTPGSKTAAFYSPHLFGSIVISELNRTKPPQLLKDRFMNEAKALLFQKHHLLYEIFDKKLQQYIEGGFTGYYSKAYNEMNDPKRFEEYEEPFAVLTLGELEAGFVVCMVPLVLSILVFAIELLSTKVLACFSEIFR